MAAQPADTVAAAPAPPQVRLRRELAVQPVRLAAALLLAVLATLAALALPLLVRRIVGDFSAHRSLTPGLLLMAAAALVGAAAQALSGFQLARVGEGMTYRLRTAVMAHALRLPLPVVRARGTGELAARVTSDAQLLGQVVEVAMQLPLAAFGVLATLTVMVWIDWVLTAVTVAALAGLTVLVLLITRRMRANVTGRAGRGGPDRPALHRQPGGPHHHQGLPGRTPGRPGAGAGRRAAARRVADRGPAGRPGRRRRSPSATSSP